MRILHTSDLHLGISVANTPLLESQRYMAEEIIKVAERERAEAVIIAGDIFDRAVTNAEAIAVYDRLMTGLCLDLGIPVLAIAGNHDGAARLSACGGLLERAGLFIAGGVMGGVKTVSLKDCDFHLLPYFSIDEAGYLYPDETITDISSAFRLLIGEIRSRFAPEKKNILVSHCYVGGAAVSESDRAALMGGAEMADAALFEGFDYVALGHLHRAQNVAPRVRYSGSPLKLSFGEASRKKTVTLVDTGSMEIEEIPVSFLRDMRVLAGTYDEAAAYAESDRERDDYMKVELKDVYAHMEARDFFLQYYPHLLIIEGKSYAEGGGVTSLSVEEAGALSSLELMRRFYTEYTGGEQPTPVQEEWFLRAVRAAEREEAE